MFVHLYVSQPVRKIIHSLKLVHYLLVQADNPWYNYYIIMSVGQCTRAVHQILVLIICRAKVPLIIVHADVSSDGLSLGVHPHFVYAREP